MQDRTIPDSDISVSSSWSDSTAARHSRYLKWGPGELLNGPPLCTGQGVFEKDPASETYAVW